MAHIGQRLVWRTSGRGLCGLSLSRSRPKSLPKPRNQRARVREALCISAPGTPAQRRKAGASVPVPGSVNPRKLVAGQA